MGFHCYFGRYKSKRNYFYEFLICILGFDQRCLTLSRYCFKSTFAIPTNPHPTNPHPHPPVEVECACAKMYLILLAMYSEIVGIRTNWLGERKNHGQYITHAHSHITRAGQLFRQLRERTSPWATFRKHWMAALVTKAFTKSNATSSLVRAWIRS